MKTCSQCGRSYPDAQRACHDCGVRLPEGAAASAQTAAHIDYLLSQLNEWVLRDWVAPVQARRIYDEYVARRAALLDPVASVPRPNLSGPITPQSPPPVAVPSSRTRGTFAAFLEAGSISYWHIVGACLLLAGVIGLVRWTWGSVGRYLIFLLLLGLTGGLYALARSRAVKNHRITATAFTATSALLTPLDLVAAHAFQIIPVRLSLPALGLGISLICLPLYGLLARRETARTFTVLVILDLAVGLHFLMQLALPGLLHTHDALALLAVYGYVYVPLAALFLIESRRAEAPEKRAVWLLAAHVTTLAALGLAFLSGSASVFGHAAATFLLAAVFYAGAAWLLGETAFVRLSCGLATLGSALLLHRLGQDYGEEWYAYALLGQALALGFWAAGNGLRVLGRDTLADAYREGMRFAAGLAVVVQVARLVTALVGFPTLSYPGTELWDGALAAAVSLGLYTRLCPALPVAVGVWGYICVLCGLLLARYAPAASVWHRQPNIALWLSFAMFIVLLGARVRSCRPALALGAVSLFFAVLYALYGGFLATTVTTLLLLTVPLVSEAVRLDGKLLFDRQILLLEALGAAALLVLLGQSRWLPLLHARFGWEMNFGYGLFALALVLLGLSVFRRDADWAAPLAALPVGAAWLLGGIAAVLQCGYVMEPGYAFTPVVLPGVGALCALGVAAARRSHPAAVWAAALIALSFVLFLIGAVFGDLSPLKVRETLAVTLLLVSAVGFLGLARQQREPWLVYSGTLTAALGCAQGLHRTLTPAPTLYPLLLLPLVVALYGAGVWRERRGSAFWPIPFRVTALVVSVLALVPIAVLFFAPPTADDARHILWSLLAYGALFAVMLAQEGENTFLFLTAALWDGAYLFALYHHAPALPLATLGFVFSLAALLWLALAAAVRGGPHRLHMSVTALFRVATAVAVLSVLIALSGLDGPVDRYAVYTLLVAGTVFLGSARGLGQNGWQHLGIGSYLLAYFAFLSKRLGVPGLATSDFYLIPIGLYVLTLGLLSRRRTPESSRQPFYLAGLLLVLTPTFIAARQPGAGPLHGPLLATECAAAIFFGLSARIRAFVVGGTAFLIALVGAQLQGYLTQLHWAVYATFLGLAIIGSALFFENRRADVLRWTRNAQERLKDWD